MKISQLLKRFPLQGSGSLLQVENRLRGNAFVGLHWKLKMNYSTPQINAAETGFFPAVKKDFSEFSFENAEGLCKIYESTFNKSTIDSNEHSRFELLCYNRAIALQMKKQFSEDSEYELFILKMMNNGNVEQKYLEECLRECGKFHLFPTNQRIVMRQALESSQEAYRKMWKKSIAIAKLVLKVMFVTYAISFYYRIYYFFEYDISIYHPRASEWHVYRFR